MVKTGDDIEGRLQGLVKGSNDNGMVVAVDEGDFYAIRIACDSK
jgi:hypothetical protein